VARFDEDYAGSVHVRQVGLASADDKAVWDYARAEGFTIISKDSDFHQRSLLFGHPPKVIWLRVGNGSTSRISAVLHGHRSAVVAFERDPEASFLVLS
jgi:predicted nuclease of predicted toxin-antitoxin system